MCASAISEVHIKDLYFGAYDEKNGGIEKLRVAFQRENIFMPTIYGGFMEKECSNLLKKFNYVRIKGEISEVKTATRGQIYLTLKDEDSILSGVIWDQKKKYLDINPEIGLEIIATGRITTWSRYKTTYQIDIDKIEIAGEGALLKLIEERKKRLQKKGYFDEDKKIPLPFLDLFK